MELLIDAVSKLGFPIVISLLLIFNFSRSLEKLTDVINKNLHEITAEIRNAYMRQDQQLVVIFQKIDSMQKSISYIMGRLDIERPNQTEKNLAPVIRDESLGDQKNV